MADLDALDLLVIELVDLAFPGHDGSPRLLYCLLVDKAVKARIAARRTRTASGAATTVTRHDFTAREGDRRDGV